MKRKTSCPFRFAVMAFFISAGMIFSAGCGKTTDNMAERSGTFFNTSISIRVYDDNGEALLDGCFEIAEEMENTFSAQKEGSELYEVNHRSSQTVTVSDDLAECISEGLHFGEISDGAFDITIYPVRELWDFESGTAIVPDESAIEEALTKVDYTKIHIEGNTLTFDSEDTMIDLGAIAKGYISAKLKNYLSENGCTSALINLGGNVSTLGTKPDGSKWTVGVQEPFSDRGEILTTVESEDNCVISSGIYERYFEVDGKMYHHILDPQTGYPAETELNQVTLVGTDDTACDALSTICMLEGKEKAAEIIKEYYPDIQVLFTDKDNNIEWME